jgi:hypothetical protein
MTRHRICTLSQSKFARRNLYLERMVLKIPLVLSLWSNYLGKCKFYGKFIGYKKRVLYCVRFEVCTVVNMKNVVFWDVALCRSWVN